MDAPSPELLQQQVESDWQRWLEQVGEKGAEIAADAEFLTALKSVWEASQYVLQSCLRDENLLPSLYTEGDLTRSFADGEMAGELSEALRDVSDEPTLHKCLRLFRRVQMVRIIWRDIAGWAPLAETLEDLSALADAAIELTLSLLYEWTCTEMGTPRNEAGEAQPLVVLGMGKLGARELNLSSDIDLIFCYPEMGQTDGGRFQTNEQFFIRLCQRLVQALDTVNADGFVFRVDTRLRPFGSAGPLAMSFDALEAYYESQAREWERYAMIKARVVAGDLVAGERLIEMLRPFVYRRYLDFGVIESLREMKILISRELHKKGMDANVKLGQGGIREIEFIGQAFQLIRGGRDVDLQIRPILPVLQLLAERNHLPEYVVRELTEAYEFLRLVENRIQAWADRQSHLLPTDDAGRLRLARAMNFADWAAFETELSSHRQRVQGHFDMVFAAPQTDGDEDAQLLIGVWKDTLDEADAIAALEEAGFEGGSKALERIALFRGCHGCRKMGAKGLERIDRLMPLLLEAVGSIDQSDVALEPVLGLLESIVRRTAYIALLVESPIVLSQLVHLSGISPWIAKLLTRHPILLDELLDPRRLYSPLKQQELMTELNTLLGGVDEDDLEQQMDRLRQFAQSNKLRVAAADITGRIPLMVVSDYLSAIAETVVAKVIELAWHYTVQRYGRPAGLEADETGFAVVGYGKLGGIELGYGSDLDMVFLHGIDDTHAMTDGESPISVDVFFARLAQRIISLFTTLTPLGTLYEVDMRLRPNGNSGMMVSSMDTFEAYQQESAWVWEHQALIRARVVAGDVKVKARFEAVRRDILNQGQEPEVLRAEVVKMREKMRDNLDKSGRGRFDLKQGVGGIVDIEFMVQYAVLRWVRDYPDLLAWTDNVRLLETLSRLGLLEGDAAEKLAEAYRVFRARYHRNALMDQPALIDDDELLGERALVKETWFSLMQG
ncbi:MAG: bifunctional [glutamate--ammonia ligase]-adenylyl-L-tyrosine phosphorylase/[glutamate--ammonia-ligase] adenylyltransferase [gamma proteobacterium endosymbiont of Lamellibrachia anaximandri]|nr:bifunctional [glutamate--ammonia ligase]-adenylyl-L-tyrosine phosphorylase/[glutamate--ammonia-ligase] adenylyltransferase [gamma proteobacterium endosymbiont of Lamellibrachia anaximandri]